jgi:hypothetical protein
MMSGMLVLLQVAAHAAHPNAGPTVAVPADWSVLAPLPYEEPPKMAPNLSGFVASEVAAGRCTMPRPADGHYVVKLDVATLVGADGLVRRVVPRAIQCPTVEQYGAGLVTSFARANLRTGATGDQWYRATIIFEWQG